jgi:hypothetical protein
MSSRSRQARVTLSFRNWCLLKKRSKISRLASFGFFTRSKLFHFETDS